MTARKLATWFVGSLLLSAGSPRARAQQEFAAPDLGGDAQLFAPVDFNFDNMPIRHRECGFFFGYDKLSWADTGERLRIGTDGTDDGSMNPWRSFQTGGQIIPNPADPDGDPILLPGVLLELPPPQLLGNIDDGGPRSKFGWGERYELGYFNDEAGWLVGVLDGPDIRFGQTYGFGLTPQDDTVADGNLGLPSRFPNAPNQLINPLGSVLIVFDDPYGLMFGFLDVVDGVVVDGPPGDPLEDDTNGDGVLDGDGFADDIDRDGQYGPDGYDLEDPVYVPDSDFVGGSPIDFDDLVRLPTTWQFVDVRNSTETNGVEIMRTHRFRNNHYMAKHQNNSFELAYGMRFLQLRDRFAVTAQGGILGGSFWDTTVKNNLVGPQVQLQWLHQRHRVLFDFNGRALLAYNVQDFEQIAALGEDLIEGQHNHPLYFRPAYNVHGKHVNDFSPTVELRAQASYQLTTAIALKLGYTAIFVDNISRAANQVRYELPRMGFKPEEEGRQEIFINGVNFGFEAVY